MHEPPSLPHRRDLLRLLSLAGCAVATATAAGKDSERLPEAQLKAAAAYSSQQGGLAVLVKQQGKVIHESYANGGGKKSAKRIYSGTKAFWCLAALAAVEDEILDLDERVAETIPEWQDHPDKSRITLNQLLHFTAGLERGLKIHNDGLADRNALALSRPMVAAPGKSFIYGPSCLQVFHEVLKRKLLRFWRKETPTRYLERRVLRPMGLGPQRYIPDAKGNPLLAAGFLMTAGQWSRMGDLLLSAGAPVLKKGSFEHLTKGSSSNGAYAFGVWNNRAADNSRAREVDVEQMLDRDWHEQSWTRACLCAEAPADLLACIGSGGNRLFAIPSLDLLVVRQGQNSRFADARFLRLLLGKT